MAMGRARYVWISLMLIILVGLICIGFFPVSHTSFSGKAAKIVLKKTGVDSCTVKRVTITGYRGISISGIRCVNNLGSSKELIISIPTVRIPYYFLRVLANRKVFQEILNPQRKRTAKKRLKGNSSQNLFTLYSRAFSTDTVLFSCIKSIHAVNGTFSVDSAGEEIMRGEGINALFKIKKASSSLLKVICSAKKLHSEKFHITNPHLIMTCKGPQWSIEKASGNVFDGSFSGNGDINILENRIDKCTFAIDTIDLEKWYTTLNDTTGSLSGRGSLTMELDSSGITFPSLLGRGSIKLTNIAADEFPLANTLALLTELSCLSHLRFKEVTGDFIVSRGRIRSENIEGSGDPLSVSVSGTVKPGGVSFDFDMMGIFESWYKDSVSAMVWNSMLPLADDRRMFKCRLYGTPQKPSVSLDKKIAQRAVRSVFKSLGDEIKGMFKKKK